MKNEDVLQRFLDYILRLRHLSPSTVRLYEGACRNWVTFAKRHNLDDLLTADAALFLDWIDQRRFNDHLNERTVERQLSALRAFYDYVRNFHGIVSPLLQLPAFATEAAAEKDFLSVNEVMAMLRTCRGKDPAARRNYLVIALLWCTGLRSRELCGINWGDIDLLNGILLVRKGKGNKQRQLFLCERLLHHLRRYRRCVLGGELSPLICSLYHRDTTTRSSDGRLSQRGLIGIVRDAANAANIPRKVNPLTLRHTFATHMFHAGVPVRDIKEMMGHDNKSETGTYIHVTLDTMRDLLNRHAGTRFLKQEGAL
jgi:site-specific recombinase XerD